MKENKPKQTNPAPDNGGLEKTNHEKVDDLAAEVNRDVNKLKQSENVKKTKITKF